MKNTLYLTKVLFLNSFGLNFSNKAKKNKKSISRIGYIALIIFLILFVGAPMLLMGIGMGVSFNEIGKTLEGVNVILEGFKTFLPLMSVMILLFSIFGIISTFFLSSDMETLLALPFKPKEIIIAKFINSLTSVYLIEIMMFLPILIGIGLGASLNILYYFNIILVTIFLPMVPLAIFGILLTSLMRYTALNRIKDKIQYVIMLFAIVVAVAIEIGSSSMGEGSVDDMANLIVNQSNALSYVMFFTFPASIALGTNNILLSIGCMLIFIIMSIGFVILFGLIGEKIYIKGVLGKPQLKIKSKKEEKVELKEEKKTSIFKELVKNEWRTVNRSPIYNMNLVLPVFLMPIILGVSMIAGFSEVDEVGTLTEFINSFKEIIDFGVGNVLVFTVAILSFFTSMSMSSSTAILSFFTSMSMSSSTAISRDGRNAYFNKIIPVEPMTIINAKVVLGIIFGFVPCLLITIILLALGLMNVLDFILINIPLFLFIVVTNYIGIYIDLRRPKLEWENETVAVKQNTNTIIYMFLDWALTMIIVAFGVILIFIRIPAFVASLILSLIFLGLYVIIYRLMKNKGLEIFNNIG